MPCMCGTAKVSSDTGTLTDLEIKLIQTTWKELYLQWEDKHGLVFFTRLFKQNPGFKPYFEAFKDQSDADIASSDKLRAHIVTFGMALDKLVTSLNDSGTVVDILHKLTDGHAARGLGVNDFKNSLDCFVGFASETAKFSKDQTNAWIKTTRVIIKVISDYVDELSNKSKEK